jgi:hypothetical protein
VWVFDRTSRRVRRESASVLSDILNVPPSISSAGGANNALGGGGISVAPAPAAANVIDPDSLFGFSANPRDYNFRYLGEREMLAAMHAASIPAQVCVADGRTICPEDWEMRHLYVVEADAKTRSNMTIPKRILYIDSETWLITASDQYDRQGKLWKTLATFNTYRDRAAADARIAVYPYKRIFQTGMVDQDLQSGYTSIALMPGSNAPDHDNWYVDMGVVDSTFFTPRQLEMAGK